MSDTKKLQLQEDILKPKVDRYSKTDSKEVEQLRFVNLLPQKDIYGIAELLNKSLAPFRDITKEEYIKSTSGYQTSIYREVSKSRAKVKMALLINHARPEQGLSIPFEGDLDAGKWAKMEQDLDVLSYYAYSNGQTTVNASLKTIMQSSPRYEKGAITPAQLKSFTQSLELAKSITVTQALALQELRHKGDNSKSKKLYTKDKEGRLITHDIKILSGDFMYKTYAGKPVAIQRIYNGKILEEFRLYGMRAVASSKGLLRIIAEQSPQQYRLAKAILARFSQNQDNTINYQPLKWDRAYTIATAGYEGTESSNSRQASKKLEHTLNKLVEYGIIDKWLDEATNKAKISSKSVIMIYPLKDIADSIVTSKQTKLIESEAKELEANHKKALKNIKRLIRDRGNHEIASLLDVTIQQLEQIKSGRLELTDEQVITISDITSTNRV